MTTGIFRFNQIGECEEIPQKDIDFWCSRCHFPLGPACSFDKALIQQCWDEGSAIAHQWHLQHECPFAHKKEECRCNSFKSIEEAFQSAGLKYKYKRA